MSDSTYSRPAIAGSGAIACGLAACSSSTAKTLLLARSDASAWRAEEQAHALCAKVDGADAGRLKVTTKPDDLAACDLIIEAIAEEIEAKVELLTTLGEAAGDADLASTTSSLSISEIGKRAGHPKRVFGMHPFNPVVRMELVELCVPKGVRKGVSERARAWCEAIGKTVVEVPEQAGFVVNRLLFPYLFDAVRMLEDSKLAPEGVDRCMTLGANHPMGPLALLDLIGIDVAIAIGEAISEETGDDRDAPPKTLAKLARAKKLGRKSREGFYTYDER